MIDLICGKVLALSFLAGLTDFTELKGLKRDDLFVGSSSNVAAMGELLDKGLGTCDTPEDLPNVAEGKGVRLSTLLSVF